MTSLVITERTHRHECIDKMSRYFYGANVVINFNEFHYVTYICHRLVYNIIKFNYVVPVGPRYFNKLRIHRLKQYNRCEIKLLVYITYFIILFAIGQEQ